MCTVVPSNFLADHGIVPPAAPASADLNGDGFVDGQDFLIWQRGFGTASQADSQDGDSDRDGDVDGEDHHRLAAAVPGGRDWTPPNGSVSAEGSGA